MRVWGCLEVLGVAGSAGASAICDPGASGSPVSLVGGVGRWLARFAYQASIGATPFIYSVLLALAVVVMTVGVHVVRVATRNPVESPRYE